MRQAPLNPLPSTRGRGLAITGADSSAAEASPRTLHGDDVSDVVRSAAARATVARPQVRGATAVRPQTHEKAT